MREAAANGTDIPDAFQWLSFCEPVRIRMMPSSVRRPLHDVSWDEDVPSSPDAEQDQGEEADPLESAEKSEEQKSLPVDAAPAQAPLEDDGGGNSEFIDASTPSAAGADPKQAESGSSSISSSSSSSSSSASAAAQPSLDSSPATAPLKWSGGKGPSSGLQALAAVADS